MSLCIARNDTCGIYAIISEYNINYVYYLLDLLILFPTQVLGYAL